MKLINQFKKFAVYPVIILLSGLAFGVSAQTTTVLTAGLNKPGKVITAGDNSLLVAEAGTTTPNSGRVSLVNRANGARQTLVGGLPSGVNNLGGPPVSSGPSGLKLQGHTLFLTIGPG